MLTLSAGLIDRLNAQLTLERTAHAAYSAFAAVCEAQSFDGFGKWHARQAADELIHAALVRDFLIDRNVTPLYAAISEVPLPANYLATFTAAQALEAQVTEALTQLYFVADDSEDPQACRLASDMLIEQRHSERELYDIVTRLNFAQNCPAAALQLDHEIGEGEV